MHGILPCGVHLVRWTTIDSSECIVCREKENITHLLYECSYAQQLWSKIMGALKVNINLSDIILGTGIQMKSIVWFLLWYTLYIRNGYHTPLRIRWEHRKPIELFSWRYGVLKRKRLYNESRTLQKYNSCITCNIQKIIDTFLNVWIFTYRWLLYSA